MNAKNKKSVRLGYRDDILGQALARGIGKETDMANHPPLEDIAAFIEEKLVDTDRNRIIDHLGACTECYEVFSESLHLREELHNRMWEKIKRSFYYAVPSAIAVTAVLLLVLKVNHQNQDETVVAKNKPNKQEEKNGSMLKSQPKTNEHVLLSAAETARMLAKYTDFKSLLFQIADDNAVSYGFTEGLSMEKATFRLGVYVMELEVAFRAEDGEKAVAVIKRITELPEPVKGNNKIILYYSDLQQKIQQGFPVKQFMNTGRNIEDILITTDTYIYLIFGEWVEGGRLAANVGAGEFINNKDVDFFIKTFEVTKLPQGVVNDLMDMKGMVSAAKGKILSGQFKYLEKLFSDIKRNL